eukprot:scaffold35020_cov61-Phaeocystis_antarctica.AAC.4
MGPQVGISRAHASERLEPSLSGDEACASALHAAKAAAAVVGAMAMYSEQLEQVEWPSSPIPPPPPPTAKTAAATATAARAGGGCHGRTHAARHARPARLHGGRPCSGGRAQHALAPSWWLAAVPLRAGTVESAASRCYTSLACLGATACSPGLLGPALPAPGCATHFGRAAQPLSAQWEAAVRAGRSCGLRGVPPPGARTLSWCLSTGGADVAEALRVAGAAEALVHALRTEVSDDCGEPYGVPELPAKLQAPSTPAAPYRPLPPLTAPRHARRPSPPHAIPSPPRAAHAARAAFDR